MAALFVSLQIQIAAFGTLTSSSKHLCNGQHNVLKRQIAENALNFHQGKDGMIFHTQNFSRAYKAELHTTGFSVQHKEANWFVDNRVIGISKSGNASYTPPYRAISKERELTFLGSAFDVQYLHSGFGLRQNFIVHKRPTGNNKLQVRLMLNSSLQTELTSPTSIGFFDTNGQLILSYQDLKVWDNKGKTLTSEMELSCVDGIYILNLIVDDNEANYPIIVDPISTTPDRLLVGDQAGAEFGISAASAGDLNGDGFSDIVVGAWMASMGQNLEGLAYVYYGSESGIGVTADIILEIDQANAEFGADVGTAGDVNGDGYSDLIVGARRWENSTATFSEGAAFIYLGSPTGINTTFDQLLESNTASAFFGSNVSTAGDIDNDGFSDVIVGAYLGSFPTTQEGAAFIYRGTPTGLVFKHRLDINHGGAHFSRSVSAGGDINGDGYSDIVIGAPQFDDLAQNDGRALVYYGSASGFGTGAAFNTPPDVTLSGSGIQSSAFGWSVSCAGDLNGDGYSDLAIGSFRDRNGQQDEGRIYVYHGSSTGLLTAPSTTIESNQIGAWMGRSISNVGDMNGDGYADLAIGAPRYNDEGVVDIHLGTPTGINSIRDIRLQIGNAGANFGEAVRSAGDVNGDGYSDVIVGANFFGSQGAAAIFHGGAFNVENNPSTQVLGDVTMDHLGETVAGVGDVNGDGFSDVLVGAPDASDGQTNEGLVYFYQTEATGLSATPQILQQNVANGDFGQAISAAGDVNGDGYGDVVIGAPEIGPAGTVYIYFGSSIGLPPNPDLTLNGSLTGSMFGASVATAGDVNGDGYSDILVGAPNSDQAYLYHGSSLGTLTTVTTLLTGSGSFGTAVSSAGDVNGDGYSDVAVGAPDLGNGIVRIYHGSIAGLTTPYAIELSTANPNAEFGRSVSAAGDVNADGFFDLVIGAPGYSNAQNEEGAVYAYFGSSSGLTTTDFDLVEGNIIGGRSGTSVDEAGDVNGDGYADIVVGGPFMSNSPAEAE